MKTHELRMVPVPIRDDRHQIAEALEYASLMDPPPGFAEALDKLEELEAADRDPRVYLEPGRGPVLYVRKESKNAASE